MNEKEINILENLIDGESSIFISARFGEGIKSSDLDYFITIINTIRDRNRNQKMIERKLVYLLIDLVPSLLGCIDLYKDSTQEKFINQVSLINESIIDCFLDD